MNLEIFKNADFEIRVAVKENEPLFCLSDVCRILEIQDTNGVKNAIDREFDKGGRFNLTPLQTAGGMQNFIQTFAGSTGAHQKFTTKITGKGQIALAGKIVDAFKGNPNA